MKIISPIFRRRRYAGLFLCLIIISATLAIISPESAFADSPAPSNGVPWPVCSSDGEWYCIESGSRDFTSITDGQGGEVQGAGDLSVTANLLDANSVNWSISWSGDTNNLPEEVANQTFRFTLRTGELEPLFTYALADKFYLTTSGNSTDGYVLNIEATPAVINWLIDTSEVNCFANDCGDDTTQADIAHRVISGNTQNMALWDPAEKDLFSGMYVASNAQYRSTVPIYGTFPSPYWYLQLGNPHLTPDSDPATGSFTAWVPESYFASLDTTASDAVDAGFSVTRDTGGGPEEIPGAAALVDGGAYLRIPSVGYSSPTIQVQPLTVGSPTVLAADPPAATGITPGAGAVTLDFDPPHFNGGATITSYTVTCTQGQTSFQSTASGSSTSATVAGLTGSIQADCSVVANNSAGPSAASQTLSATPSAAPTTTSVVAAPSSQSTSANGELVQTGSDPLPLVVIATSLVIIGFIIGTVQRSRRRIDVK